MTSEEANIRKFKLNDVVVLKDKPISRIYRVVGLSKHELSVYVRCRESGARDRFHEDQFELYMGVVPDDLPLVAESRILKELGEDDVRIATSDVVGDSIKILANESSSLMRAIKRGNVEESGKSVLVEVYVKKILRHEKRKCEIIAVTGEVSLIK